jgi:hypothetical protein
MEMLVAVLITHVNVDHELIGFIFYFFFFALKINLERKKDFKLKN